MGKHLADRLSYQFRSAGDGAGQEASRRGVTIHGLQVQLNEDPAYDWRLDEELTTWGERQDCWVMDHRLRFVLIPEAVSIILEVSSDEAVRRILMKKRKGEFSLGLIDSTLPVIQPLEITHEH